MGYKEKYINWDSSKIDKEILKYLTNQIFHVTSIESYKKIKESGFIKSNKNKKFEFTFPISENSFGNKNGYICLFDFRNKNKEQIQRTSEDFLYRAVSKFKNPVFLIVNSKYNLELKYQGKYTNKKNGKEFIYFEELIGSMIVPFTECWYSGDMPLSKIIEVLKIKVA